MKKDRFNLNNISKYILAALISHGAVISALADVKSNAFVFKSASEKQLIVKFKSNQTNGKISILSQQAQVQSRIDSLKTEINFTIQMQNHMGSGATLLEVKSSSQSIEEMAAELEARPDVEYAVPNIRLHTMATPNDPRYNEQWHYFEKTGSVNASNAWDLSLGEGAVVAVVDTGYRPHVDLASNILPGYDFVSNAKNARDNDGRDPNAQDEGDWFGLFECASALFGASNSSWHGTHVAGTIAAVSNNGIGVAGIAPKAKILPVRVLARCGGTLADIQDGMLWAAGLSVPGIPDNKNPADIINLSLGGGAACDRAMQDVVDQVTAAGTIVIAAAGNSNADASGFTPASCNNVLTVASTNRAGARAKYSNFGKVVEIAAPGGETAGNRANGILSTLNAGTKGPTEDNYKFYQGTSMAAPHAAGVAALIVSRKPSITPAELTKVMQDTSRPFSGTCTGCGTGIIDAEAAVKSFGNGGNILPNADFTVSNNVLKATFKDSSTDRDGTLVRWSWNFGDKGVSTEQNPTHTYKTAGTYSVSLTVTDNAGATDTRAQNVTVGDVVNNIKLTATKQKIFIFTRITLSWSKVDGVNVDLYKNGVKSSVANTGTATDTAILTGSNTYKVCKTNTSECSNETVVKY